MKKLLIILFFSMMSCQNDVENVTVKGTVLNDETGLAMEGIKVSFVCWFYGNSADESYTGEDKKTVTTNKKGEYEVQFDKGAFIEIKVNENGFSKIHESKHISSKNNTVNIKLKPN